MDEAFFKDDTLSSTDFQWGKEHASKTENQVFPGNKPENPSAELYKNQFIKSDKAKEAMYNLASWEFDSSQKLIHDKAKDHDLKCIASTSWRRRRDPKVLTPNKWIHCPFGHLDGAEYLTDPLHNKKLDGNRGNRGFRTARKKEHPSCPHCLHTKFQVHMDPSMYYKDYLEQTFQSRNPQHEDTSIWPRNEIKESIEAALTNSKDIIIEEEENIRRLSKILLKTEISPSTPSNWLGELKDLLDPEKKLKGFHDSSIHHRSTKIGKSKYGIQSALRKNQSINNTPRRPITRNRPTSSGKYIIGRKMDLKAVKSRYLKSNKSDDEGSQTNNNPFPMPGDKITKTLSHSDFLKKSSTTPLLKDPKMTILKASVNNESQSAKPLISSKKIFLPRLEGLSKPVKRSTTKIAGSKILYPSPTKKRTKPLKAKTKKSKVTNTINEKKTTTTASPNKKKTKKKSKIKAPKVISHYGGLFSKKSSKTGKKKQKDKVLQAFGFEFRKDEKDFGIGTGSEDNYDSEAGHNDNQDENFSKEKYRRYVLRMLEKSMKEAREAKLLEDTNKKEKAVKEKTISSSPPQKLVSSSPKQKNKDTNPIFKINVSAVTNDPSDSYPKPILEEKVEKEKLHEPLTHSKPLKTPSIIKLEIPTSNIRKTRIMKSKAATSKTKASGSLAHDRGDSNEVSKDKKSNFDSPNPDHISGSGEDIKRPLARNVSQAQIQPELPNEINPLESVISTAKYYKPTGLKTHNTKARRGHFYSASKLTPRFPIKTFATELEMLSQELPKHT